MVSRDRAGDGRRPQRRPRDGRLHDLRSRHLDIARNKGDFIVAVEGDRRLFNQYGVMLVNPAKHPNVKMAAGQQFIDWLISAEGQRTIAAYKINGQQLFYPNANDPAA
jgi:ABC-type tungstate transport system permease subunit